ncbi:MAG: Gfo/Idh/MocA family oxidoreductase [Holophaga sp.]
MAVPEKLKVGIAGYGVVGKRRHHFLDRNSEFRTVAVCDRVYRSEGVREDGLRYYPHYSRLLQEDLDVLFVCVPNYLAPEITIAGLERGLHVFCEKPPGRSMQDVCDVIRCERRHPGLKLKYGFNHRYHDSVSDALRLIQGGELGEVLNLRGVYGKSKIISFQSDWRTRFVEAGGGILLDQGIHMVDLMRLFAGEFTEVKSFVSNSFWKHDVEDNAYALMRTPGGVVAMLHSSATQWRHCFELEIALTRGALTLSGILSGSKSYGAETMSVAWATEDDGGDPKEVRTRYNEDHSWSDEILEFGNAIRHGGPILHGSSRDALMTMRQVFQIYCADPGWSTPLGLDCRVPEDIEHGLG